MNTIMGRYGRPLLQTIATLAATRSCLLVYLSHFALCSRSLPSSAQKDRISTQARMMSVALYSIEGISSDELDSLHQLHSVRYIGH